LSIKSSFPGTGNPQESKQNIFYVIVVNAPEFSLIPYIPYISIPIDLKNYLVDYFIGAAA
jgi:hypothetical protein